MALSFDDHKAIMAGFAKLGFACIEAPSGAANPIRIEWNRQGPSRGLAKPRRPTCHDRSDFRIEIHKFLPFRACVR
jgi:hypothetical protein